MRSRHLHPQRLIPSLGIAVLMVVGGGSAHAQSARFDEFVDTSPKAGELAPEFTLVTLEGEPFNLMEVVADVPVVVEFGSFT